MDQRKEKRQPEGSRRGPCSREVPLVRLPPGVRVEEDAGKNNIRRINRGRRHPAERGKGASAGLHEQRTRGGRDGFCPDTPA